MEANKVYNLTTHQTGERTGESHECSSDGCSGLRLRVDWPSGGYTYECTSRMVYQPNSSNHRHRSGTMTPVILSIEAGSWVIPEGSDGGCGQRVTKNP